MANAADWLSYVEDITALGTEWKKHRGIISVPDPALDRVRSLTAFAQTDLNTLNTLIANAEDVIDDVMFPVSPLPHVSSFSILTMGVGSRWGECRGTMMPMEYAARVIERHFVHSTNGCGYLAILCTDLQVTSKLLGYCENHLFAVVDAG